MPRQLAGARLAHGAARLRSASLIGLLSPGSRARRLGLRLLVVALWLAAWLAVDALADAAAPAARALPISPCPSLFGACLLFLWEVVGASASACRRCCCRRPPPIGARFAGVAADRCGADFVQTFLKAVLAGYVDRLRRRLRSSRSWPTACRSCSRGLLPLGNFVAALPIVGIAPIMVMWFGFDWQSKAAVVVVMTFFPMLVNTVAGLAAAERDAARPDALLRRRLLARRCCKLRLPAAMPFIFNGLKINSTLALIGAIVAEFFGTPIVGMGFRISTEVGAHDLDMVWAEIAVAALAGSAVLRGRRAGRAGVTFWHPSYRT